MLSFVRAIGFLAPLAVGILVTVTLAIAAQADPGQRPTLLAVLALAAVAGMTTMALIAWSYFGWRLNRIASALERTLENDEPIELSVAWLAPSMPPAARSPRSRSGPRMTA